MSVLNLPNIIRAGTLALVLGGTAFAAAPVQAQSIQFNFSIGKDYYQWNGRRDFRGCMRDPQVRRDLRRSGYDDIRFFDRKGRVVQVVADKGRRSYAIAYDTCRGRIVDRDQIRRR